MVPAEFKSGIWEHREEEVRGRGDVDAINIEKRKQRINSARDFNCFRARAQGKSARKIRRTDD